ncbi:MAG: sigma 54-interacting transcriptional regulator [Kofleriaceae bacterium]
MLSLSEFEALPEVALARDLLRAWYGLEVSLVVADDLRGALERAQPCRAIAASAAPSCAESFAALSAAILNARAAEVHRCHAGIATIAAPILRGDRLVGAVLARAARHPETEAKVAELLGVRAEEAAAIIEGAPALREEDLRRAGDLAMAAARAISRALAAAPQRDAAVEAPRHPFLEMIGTAPAILEVAKLVEKVARSQATALIHGESGTGKELIARAIHYHGPRAKKPFIVQNCSAFNDNLLESALFGHARGAFTGAVKDQRGLFEAADGGTFFLDEIGDMSAALQVKLLRVLQEGTFTPVGGTKPLKVDVRVVAASHKDLAAMVARKEFREDLFYRVNVLKISLPPLRERRSDIPLLVQHFLKKHGPTDRPRPYVSASAMAVLMSYAWPGNIRELENEIERMLVLAGNADELVPSMISPRITGQAHAATTPVVALADLVRGAVSQAITSGLLRTHGDRETLARELGISRGYLEMQCRALGLEVIK